MFAVINPAARVTRVIDADLNKQIQDLSRELRRLRGQGVTAANGGDTCWVRFGTSSVLVEYEIEHDGDGEPTGEVALLCAYINGLWVNVDEETFSPTAISAWDADVKRHIAGEIEAVEEARAEQALADRRSV